MIDFSLMDLASFWQECDEIFEQFEREKMPSECYGWRSWKIEKAFEKHSSNMLNWVDEVGYDFVAGDNLKYEMKQVKDAFSPKNKETPTITLKNFRKDTLNYYDQTFDYILVIDVERRILGVYDWEYIYSRHNINSATVTAILEHSKAKKLYTHYYEIA
tara:strand:+ start:44 stop:520 length:477 start_codon:yes stop_codon:yes gene_type:complete